MTYKRLAAELHIRQNARRRTWLAALTTLALSVGGSGLAHADPNAPSVNTPVIYVHGVQAVSQVLSDASKLGLFKTWVTGGKLVGNPNNVGTDCQQGWGPMIETLRKLGFKDQVTVGYYAGDKHCDASISSSGEPGKTASDQVYGQSSSGAALHDVNTDIRHLAYNLAWYIYDTYSKDNKPVSIVAHSMGGLITRYALGMAQAHQAAIDPSTHADTATGIVAQFPPYLLVDKIVTLGTPHNGDASVAHVCKYLECLQMNSDAPEGQAFYGELATMTNPQGRDGTGWTTIGSQLDGLVPSDSAVAMDSNVKIKYISTLRHPLLPPFHTQYPELNDQLYKYAYQWQHRGETIWHEWVKAPSPVLRAAQALEHPYVQNTTTANGTVSGGAAPPPSDLVTSVDTSPESDGPVLDELSCLPAGTARFKRHGSVHSAQAPGGSCNAPPPTCLQPPGETNFGLLEVVAQCLELQPDNGTHHTVYKSEDLGDKSHGELKINGIAFKPLGGTAVSLDTTDANHVVVFGPDVQVSIWDGKDKAIPLNKPGPISLTLPKTTPANVTDASGRASFNGLSSTASIRGLHLGSVRSFEVIDKHFKLTVRLEAQGGILGKLLESLPTHPKPGAEVDPASAKPGVGFEASIVTGNEKGIELDGIELSASNIFLGPVPVKEISFKYSASEDKWEGQVTAELPFASNVEVHFQVALAKLKVPGALNGAWWLSDIKGGVAHGLNVPLWGGVVLDGFQMGIGDFSSSNPTVVIELSINWGHGLIALDPARLTFSPGDSTHKGYVLLEGLVTVVKKDWQIAQGRIQVFWSPQFRFHIEGEFKPAVDLMGNFGSLHAGINAHVVGDIQTNPFHLYFEQGIDACFSGSLKQSGIAWLDKFTSKLGTFDTCNTKAGAVALGAQLIVDVLRTPSGFSGGVALCGTVSLGPFTESIGAVYNWTTGWDTIWGTCDVAELKSKIAQVPLAGNPITIAPGTGGEMIGISGMGAPPQVTLVGPSGQSIASPPPGQAAAKTDSAFVFYNGADDTTYFMLAKPAAGQWAIQDQLGSTPITAVNEAPLLPHPSVQARIARTRGRRSLRRVLTYKLLPIAGQEVAFVDEDGRGDSHVIGIARGAQGRIGFLVPPSPVAIHKIVATVVQYGRPRAQLTVVHYRAAPLRPPGPLHGLHLRRQGSLVIARWQRVRGARQYIISAASRNGPVRSWRVSASHHRVGIASSGGPITVSVAGVTGDTAIGRAGRASLR